MYKKRGQVTPLVIVGIVILAVVILLFYFRSQFFFGPVTKESLEERFQPLRAHILDCLQDRVPDYLERIGLQGGHLKTPEGTFRLYQDIPVSYLCYDIPEDPRCYNRLLTPGDMEQELALAIQQELASCLRYDKFERGFDLKIGSMSVSVGIGPDKTDVTVHQTLTAQRDGISYVEDTFTQTFAVPLGKLYDVSQDILDVETQYGDFEQLAYMIGHKGAYVIDKKKPYPDKLYILQTKDSDYLFQFFVEDEPSAAQEA